VRAAATEQTDSVGVKGVWEDFARLGWGPVENTHHDLGTDLYLQVRDERRFDLGLVVGAQVKSGASYFSRPARAPDGEITGWWFNDADREHVDAWLRHALPHLLVLRDIDANVSYWIHVTADAVVNTGKGAKLCVPRSNIVNEAHRDQLTRVATTGKPAAQWEGSVWTAGGGVLPKDRLRHALIAPRLVAPHPNAGTAGGLSGDQATALVMQARFAEYRSYATDVAEVPPLGEALLSDEWSWKFVGALARRMRKGQPDELIARVEDASNPKDRAAAAVAAAACLLEDGLHDEARALIEAALAPDDQDPVDQAWLRIHRARIEMETGEIGDARASAAPIPAVRFQAPEDATAGAIAASATNLLFNTAAWTDRDLERTIIGSDNAVSWWRAQGTSRGLQDLVSRTFRSWSSDRGGRWSAEDLAARELFAAALAASHTGDQSSWRRLQSLQAQDALLRLDRAASPEEAMRGLDGLRIAGDVKSMKLAARHLESEGPASAVIDACAKVDLGRSSRTTGLADLEMLECGADIISADVADRSTRWLLKRIADPATITGGPVAIEGYSDRMLSTVAALIPRCQRDTVNDLIALLLGLPPVTDQAQAETWAKTARGIPAAQFTEEQSQGLAASAQYHHSSLRLAFLSCAAGHVPAAREQLAVDARAGSVDALSMLGPVPELPSEVAEAAIKTFANSAISAVEMARNRTYGIGYDVAGGLVMLNAWHPDHADWQPVIDLLSEPLVTTDMKRSALRHLTALIARLPDSIRSEITPIVLGIATGSIGSRQPFLSVPGDAAGEATDLAIGLAAVDDVDLTLRLAALLSGDSHDRSWAAHAARRRAEPGDIGVLAALATDPDVNVRAAAAAGLAVLDARGSGGAVAHVFAERCLSNETGTRVARAVAEALDEEPGSRAEEIRASLRNHASFAVRRSVQVAAT
jgi:hypothetical protein